MSVPVKNNSFLYEVSPSLSSNTNLFTIPEDKTVTDFGTTFFSHRNNRNMTKNAKRRKVSKNSDNLRTEKKKVRKNSIPLLLRVNGLFQKK